MTTDSVVAAVWRTESARLVGALLRVTRDLGQAEDLVQDALVAALEQWPTAGVPTKPGAWLMTVARRKLIDGVRRAENLEAKLDEVARLHDTEVDPVETLELERHVADDLLRLMFAACHPVLAPEARVALTLRAVAGLTTEQIARSFVVPTATMAARITRAKKAIAAAGVPFEVPVGAELDARLPSVLETVYLVFNEGYTATSGESWARPELCGEAMRLGRMLVALAPTAEPLGLVALMEIQASRLRARVSQAGEPVTLLDQDRSRWDRLLITHALGFLDRAVALDPRGTYVLQAAIAACHARAARASDTDWVEIARLYGVLVDVTDSPVVELNRAVAVSMADGPAAGLAVVDGLVGLPALRDYHLLPSVRGDLLAKLGRRDEAVAEFERAATMTSNDVERSLLRRRASALRSHATALG